MHQNTAPTCPAPRTASAELHAVADELRSGDASGRPIPADARCEYCRQVGNGCSPARCRNPAPVIPPAQPKAPATPDNRRVVRATCTCVQRYKGERFAPSSVSVLSLPGTTDQDVADAVGVALCRLRSAAVIAERDGEDMSAAVQLATQYIDRAEKHLLAVRGITVGVEHAL